MFNPNKLFPMQKKSYHFLQYNPTQFPVFWSMGNVSIMGNILCYKVCVSCLNEGNSFPSLWPPKNFAPPFEGAKWKNIYPWRLSSKNVHDESLPTSIQTVSCKFLLNLVDCIRQRSEQGCGLATARLTNYDNKILWHIFLFLHFLEIWFICGHFRFRKKTYCEEFK